MNSINYYIDNIKPEYKKIFFTGSHGTGKTTCVFDLATKLKIKFPNKTITVLYENAKHNPLKLLNKNTTPLSQMWIFCNQLQNELKLSTEYDIIIGDRTIIDPISYSIQSGFYELADSMKQMALQFINTYDLIYFKTIEKNDYLFHDGVRDSTDLEYRQKIENTLKNIYEELLEKSESNTQIIYI